MQAPKKKTSKSKRNMRRAHHALTPAMFIHCESCSELKLRHCICPHCGSYRGRQMVTVATDD